MTSAVDSLVAGFAPGPRAMVEALRRLVREVAPDMIETIKWNAPSYSLDGRDLATLNVGRKGEVRLVLHRGARATGAPPGPFQDRHGLADWPSPDRGVVQLREETDLSTASPLAELLRDWIAANR